MCKLKTETEHFQKCRYFAYLTWILNMSLKVIMESQWSQDSNKYVDDSGEEKIIM